MVVGNSIVLRPFVWFLSSLALLFCILCCFWVFPAWDLKVLMLGSPLLQCLATQPVVWNPWGKATFIRVCLSFKATLLWTPPLIYPLYMNGEIPSGDPLWVGPTFLFLYPFFMVSGLVFQTVHLYVMYTLIFSSNYHQNCAWAMEVIYGTHFSIRITTRRKIKPFGPICYESCILIDTNDLIEQEYP